MITRRARGAALVLLAGLQCGDASAGPETLPETRAEAIVRRIEGSALTPEIGAVVELEVARPSRSEAEEYRVAPAGALPFGRDGAGGLFYVLPDGRILLVDSEGSFGVVGADLDGFLAIATGLPGWRDALRFMTPPKLERARAGWEAFVRGSGLAAGMERPWPYGSAGYATATPGAARRAIRAGLGIAPVADPFAALHRAVNALGADVTVSSKGELLVRFGRVP